MFCHQELLQRRHPGSQPLRPRAGVGLKVKETARIFENAIMARCAGGRRMVRGAGDGATQTSSKLLKPIKDRLIHGVKRNGLRDIRLLQNRERGPVDWRGQGSRVLQLVVCGVGI